MLLELNSVEKSVQAMPTYGTSVISTVSIPFWLVRCCHSSRGRLLDAICSSNELVSFMCSTVSLLMGLKFS